MAKYLDWGGLLTFWAKIKTWVGDYAKITTTSGTTKITLGENDITPITTITAGAGLNTTSNDTGTDGGNITGNSGTLHLTKSGVTAGSYGPNANATPAYGTTFNVPQVTVDKYGRVISASTKTVTVPASDNTDTKVNVKTRGTTKAYLLGTTTAPTSSNLAVESVAEEGVYFDTVAGELHATNFGGKINEVTVSKETTGFTIAGGTTSKTLTVNKTYTLADACAKGVDTSIGNSSSANLPTTDAVKSYVSTLMSSVTGALVYQGTVSAEATLLNTALSKGWYYIVTMPSTNPATTSVTIGGVVCEAGDMIIVKTAGTYTTSGNLGAAVDVILTNIDTITENDINSLT